MFPQLSKIDFRELRGWPNIFWYNGLYIFWGGWRCVCMWLGSEGCISFQNSQLLRCWLIIAGRVTTCGTCNLHDQHQIQILCGLPRLLRACI